MHGAGAANSVTATATDYDADIQSFCCNISADDVKTEIIEGDTGELVMLEQQQQQQQLQQQQQQQHHQQQHPRPCSVTPLTASAVNYYKLPPMAELPMSSSVGGRKRKLLGLHVDTASPSKQPVLGLQQHLQQHLQLQQQQLQQHQHQHQHQQQQHTQPQHSNAQASSKSRERELLSAGVGSALAFAAAGNSHSQNSNNNNNGNNLNNNGSTSNLHNQSSNQNPKANTNNQINAGSSSSSSNSNNNNTQAPNDEYGVFGEYVAITIRKLKTPKAKIVIKHLINNLLYEAELGKYDHGMPSSKEPPQLYKM